MKNIPSFRTWRPAAVRLWHWSNALLVLALLGTVVLRKTFLSWRANAPLIESKASAAGVALPADVAKQIAQALRDGMWQWHYWIGFAVAGLFLARVLYGLATRQLPGLHFLNSLRAWKSSTGAQRSELGHLTIVKLADTGFFLMLLTMAATGLLMYFAPKLGIAKEVSHDIQEIHENLMWGIVGFIVIHLAGVLRMELTRHPGLISDMVNGGPKQS